MTLGISLAVNADQVRKAKGEVQLLNRALQQTESEGKLDLGNEALSSTSALVKKLSDDIRRLKGIATSGDRKGGLLQTGQFEEAEKLSRKIRENFSGYASTLGRAREELSRLIRERRNLEEIDSSGKYEVPEAFFRRRERMQSLQERINTKQGEIDRLSNYRGKVAGLQREASEAAGNIAGFAAPGMGANLLRRSLAGGAALFGGLSVISLLRESLDQAKLFSPLESDLIMRGGRNLRENAGSFGFLPLESLRASDQLNRHLGYGGSELGHLTETAKKFSRGYGISLDTTTSYAAGTHQSLGLSGPLFEKHLTKLTAAVEKSGIGGRVEEFLRINSELLNKVTQGTGGHPLTDRESGYLTSLQASLWAQRGVMGEGSSGADFLSRFHEGIRGGGRTPGMQLFLFRALGGEGIRNVSDYEKYLRRQEAGIGDPRNLKDILHSARRNFGDDGKGGLSTLARLNLRSIFGLSVEQTRLASRMLAGGDFDEKSISRFLQGGDISRRADFAMKLPGNDHRLQEARLAAKEIGPGTGLMESMDLLKKGALDAADGLGYMTEKMKGFLRPELSEKDRARMNVMGISGSSPWKDRYPEYGPELPKGKWQSVPPGETGGGAAPSTGMENSELLGELRRIGNLLEQQQNNPQPVEVRNFPGPAPPRVYGSGR